MICVHLALQARCGADQEGDESLLSQLKESETRCERLEASLTQSDSQTDPVGEEVEACKVPGKCKQRITHDIYPFH